MFLRANRRFKDGKEHRYWNIVENRRCSGGKVVQRQILYLGEISDGQYDDWSRAIEAFDEDTQRHTQLSLFPSDRAVHESPDVSTIGVQLNKMELHRPRQWGACWLACELYEQLGLDTYWQQRLTPSREGTDWSVILQILVCYRLIDPGSEWCLHRQWFGESAMADLFGARFEVLLFDLISTYFESPPPVNEEDKRRFGYGVNTGFGFAHTISFQIDAMSIVHDVVQYCVGDRGICFEWKA